MKRLVLPLLFAFSLPSLLFAEKSPEQILDEIRDQHEQAVHNKCLKYVDYEFCRELVRKGGKIIGDLEKRNTSSMFKLIGDICEAGEKGLLENPRAEFFVLRALYKEYYPATEEEKKIILFEHIRVRSDVFNITKYTVKSYPGCIRRKDEN